MPPDPAALPDALLRPEAYPDDPDAARGIEHIETHISHLFLTRSRVYKLRKPVEMPFLDFRSRAERNRDCLREVALNRRLAPDVYVGVAPIEESGPGGARVGPAAEALASGPGAPPEHCVVMRRLPADGDAESRLRKGELSAERVEAVAALLARFHRDHRLPSAALPEGEAWYERVARPARANLEVLAEHLDAPRHARLAAASEARLARVRPWLEARRRLGLPVDGHGDLRLEHVWFEGEGPPRVIDCVEFDAALRQTDPADDLGFFAMGLLRYGAKEEARRFLQRYASESDDFGLYAVIDHFIGYAALVRAKVAALQGHGAGSARFEAQIGLAGAALAAPARPAVLALGGVVGTGKSTAARAVAACTGAVVIRSDRVRQRFAALAGEGAAGYGEETKDAVYTGVLERARPVLASGRPVVLDATYARRRWRRAARELAVACDAPFVFLETRCAEEVALERLARRRAEGGDPSEAGPERYSDSVAEFEKPEPDEAEGWWRVETDTPGWRERLGARLAERGLALPDS